MGKDESNCVGHSVRFWDRPVPNLNVQDCFTSIEFS
jgi:hypothetical protein